MQVDAQLSALRTRPLGEPLTAEQMALLLEECCKEAQHQTEAASLSGSQWSPSESVSPPTCLHHLNTDGLEITGPTSLPMQPNGSDSVFSVEVP